MTNDAALSVEKVLDKLVSIEGRLARIEARLEATEADSLRREEDTRRRLATIENYAGTGSERASALLDQWERTFLVRRLKNPGLEASVAGKKDRYENAMHLLLTSLFYGGRMMFWQGNDPLEPVAIPCTQPIEFDSDEFDAMMTHVAGAVPPEIETEEDREKGLLDRNDNATLRSPYRVQPVPMITMLRNVLARTQQIVASLDPPDDEPLRIAVRDAHYASPSRVFGVDELIDAGRNVEGFPVDSFMQSKSRFMQRLVDDGILIKVSHGKYRKK